VKADDGTSMFFPAMYGVETIAPLLPVGHGAKREPARAVR
jgi:hypothetical protein